MSTMDIFSQIAKRDAAPVKKATKLVKRYAVMHAGRSSRKLYTYAQARKLTARAKRMGLDCYMSPMMVRVTA